MTKSSSMTVLLGLGVLSALLSLGLFWGITAQEAELRELQRTAARVNNTRTLVGLLGNEAVEYSKKNPSIDPILESAGFKQPKTASAAAAAKPATK